MMRFGTAGFLASTMVATTQINGHNRIIPGYNLTEDKVENLGKIIP
jgi:hypothetical protein